MVIDLIKRYGLAKNDLQKLNEALKNVEYKRPKDLTDQELAMVIEKFGYSVDTFWKYLRDYKNTLGVKVEVNDPADVFTECFSAALINKEEFDILMNMLNDYSSIDKTAADILLRQEMYSRILTYYQIMKTIVDRQPAFE